MDALDRRWFVRPFVSSVPASRDAGVAVAAPCTPRTAPRRSVHVEGLESRRLFAGGALNLQVSAATYLGGPVADTATSVDVAPDKTVVYGGTSTGNNFGLAPTTLLGGTSGIVLRLNATGTKVLSVTRIGATVNEVKVDPANREIAVCGDFGVAVLDPTAHKVLWRNATVGNVARIDFASDGTLAALVHDSGSTHGVVTVFNADAKITGTITFNSSWRVRDVAVDPATKHVYACGDYGTHIPTGQVGPVQIAYLQAFDYGARFAWTDWGWGGAQIPYLAADTYGWHVAVGRDGKLYFAGESAGGNTIFSKDAKDLTKAAPNYTSDAYNTPYNTASNHIAYIAKLDPATGKALRGEFALTRLSSGKANTCFARGGITADASGNVYLSGTAAFQIENRDGRTINGVHLPPYQGDGYVLELSSDFTTRKLWASWGAGAGTGVAVGYGIAATCQTTTASAQPGFSGPLLTFNAIEPKPLHATSKTTPTGFLAVWNAV